MAKFCGFSALRCVLTILNVFYVVVGVFLIGLVVAARTLAYFTNVPILVGIAVCGTLMVAVAVLGLVGTIKHHQVMLFFYMIVLGLSGVILFAVSVAALAAPKSWQDDFFQAAWMGLSFNDKEVIQSKLNCCGFNRDTRYIYTTEDPSDGGECDAEGHPRCNSTEEYARVPCCQSQNYTALLPIHNCSRESICQDCRPCFNSWDTHVSNAVLVAGSFGLIFSFTQVIGIVLTFWYRNQKDPNANPSAFL